MRGIRLQRWAATAACATLIPFAPLAVAATPDAAPGAASAATVLDSNQERLDLEADMARLIQAGRFAEIIGRAEGDFADGTRLSDGSWRGYEIYMAFEQALDHMPLDDKAWDRLLDTLRERADTRPADVFLYVQALHSRGWAVRGGGTSGTVSSSRYRSFRQIMEAGRDALDHHRKALVDAPMWYSQRTTLFTETGGSPRDAEAVFREGQRRFPDYLPLYSTRVRYLAPKWHGSEDELMDLLDEIAAKPALDRKEGLYARVTWLSENEGYAVFLDPRFKKAVLRASFDALVASRPDLRNRQRYFISACEVSDTAAARSQIAAIREPVGERELRREPVLIKRCRDWIEANEPWIMRIEYRGERKEVLVATPRSQTPAASSPASDTAPR